MSPFLARRLVGVVINLILVSMFVFGMLRLVPGDTAIEVLGETATTDQLEQFREEYGLDQPVVGQYKDWVFGLLTGDFGKSLTSKNDVTKDFMERLPITLEIVFFSFTISTFLGISVGILSAQHQNSFLDISLRLIATLALAVPNFLLLSLLLIVPARLFNYAPPFGETDIFANPIENLRLILPPTAILALSSSAIMMRFTRSGFLGVMRQDYIRTARSKGLTERTIAMRHALRNALPPVLTLAGLQLGGLLGGSVILEQVMSLPGLGSWTLQAVQAKNYPVVMIVTLYGAVTLMTINLILDFVYAAVDPRIRYW
jgi:peptide/nickel transport system permease protein